MENPVNEIVDEASALHNLHNRLPEERNSGRIITANPKTAKISDNVLWT